MIRCLVIALVLVAGCRDDTGSYCTEAETLEVECSYAGRRFPCKIQLCPFQIRRIAEGKPLYGDIELNRAD